MLHVPNKQFAIMVNWYNVNGRLLHCNWHTGPKIEIPIGVIQDQLIVGGEEGLNVVNTSPFGQQVVIVDSIL